jgi:CheY-like chemotaxis protein
VCSAATGEEGLRMAAELQPCAIILDVVLPEMDGWTVLATLKASDATADIPVIMLTMVDDKTKGYALGATDYITKPFDRDRLFSVLRRFHGESPLHPIMVVEDDTAQREMLSQMLEREGWPVAKAEDGLAALELLAQHRPALILLDLLMPVMDGYEFLDELRKHDTWRSIPVVVITSVDLDESGRNHLSGYVQRILQKGSYEKHELLQVISDNLGGRTPPLAAKEEQNV